MATAFIICEKIERSFKRQRIFRDRTMQLDDLADSELFSRYRMPRHAIMTLVELVRPQLERPTQRSHPLSPETQVLLTLRYLGKGGFLSEISDLHGVSEASVSRAFHDTVRAINGKLDNISFPWTKEEQERTKLGFCAISGFPKVVGSADGTLIPIKRPSVNEEMAFVCRKGYHAINVQGVCDSELRFTNVVVRWPGSTHDSLLLNNSGLGKKLETGLLDGWLLGDSGYACRPWLLTPLVEPQNRLEERYNSSHARTRNTIERAFGVLKSKFREMQLYYHGRLSSCTTSVLTTTVHSLQQWLTVRMRHPTTTMEQSMMARPPAETLYYTGSHDVKTLPVDSHLLPPQ